MNRSPTFLSSVFIFILSAESVRGAVIQTFGVLVDCNVFVKKLQEQ